MKKTVICLLTLSSFLIAEERFDFTPQLTIETEFGQDLNSDLKAGSSALAKMEAGFKLCFKEKLIAATNIEADVESENVNIQLNEAFLKFAPKDIANFSFGQFVNSFGVLESEALSDPLIKDDVETKVPGFQVDLGNEKFYGAISIYQGLMTNNFKACVPALGMNLNNKFTAKLSARIEMAEDTYSDLSFGFGIMPAEIFAFHAELYTELIEKVFEDVSTKKLGYFADAAIFPVEKLLLALQFNQLILNTKENDKEGDILLIDVSVRYTVFNPFTLTLAFTTEGENISDNYEWTPALTINATVEF